MSPPIGGVRAGYISGQRDAIPDSSVGRADDNGSFNTSGKSGILFELAATYSDINGRISSNTANLNNDPTAYAYKTSDSTLIDKIDISGNTGEVFTLSGSFSANTQYSMVLDDGGDTWTAGFTDADSLPTTNGDVTFLDGGTDGTGDSGASNPRAIDKIGGGF